MPRLRPRAVLNRSDLRQRSAFEETPNGGAEPAGRAGGDYMARLITYIPGEVIAVYQAVAGLLKPQAKAPSAAEVSAASGPLLAVGLVLLLLTPIWIFFSTRERNEPAAVHQIVISTLAFLVWLLAVDHHVSSDPGLSELTDRDGLCATEERVIRIVLVPATELPGLQTHPGIALTPPIRLAIVVKVDVHTIANGPRYGDLAGQSLTSSFCPERSGEYVSVLFGCGHAFLQA